MLRVALASAGRFHLLDLARELDALGVDARFHAYVPPSRMSRFGLPARAQASHFAAMTPFLAWQRLAPALGPGLREKWTDGALNTLVSTALQPCDVFIGMSGIYLEAAAAAKRRYGAKIVLERGSGHILDQNQILIDAGGRPASAWATRRELAGYELADVISIPSLQVAESFERDPSAHRKCVVNPYGVDLELFPARKRPAGGPPTIIMVGAWCLRKGADILAQAVMNSPELHLLHVGPLGDVAFPSHVRFEHVDPVSQERLGEFYARADVLALPSREDGFGVVLLQALASGLPVVGSYRSGAVDLATMPQWRDRVWLVAPEDIGDLAAKLAAALDQASVTPDPDRRPSLSWRAYGERYLTMLQDLVRS